MNKQKFKDLIQLYINTENIIKELDTKYGIRIWDSKNPNFYNNYHLMIHNLFVEIFGGLNTDVLEDYLWEQTDISFDKLCDILNINETDDK